MNAIIYLSLMVITVWLSPAKPSTDAVLSETVRSSLTNGDARQLSTQFAKTLELIIDTENVEFPSLQSTHAELILRSFFRRYPPHRFHFVYHGSADRMHYSTGTYQTDGQTFSVYILMRQKSDQQLVINSLHFRKE